jgi:hypothetical protein
VQHHSTHIINQESIERQASNIDLGLQMKDMGISLKVESKEETPQNLTPKLIEELAKKVLGSKKIVEMFQTMAIVNLKMGNLGLEIKSFKTRLI